MYYIYRLAGFVCPHIPDRLGYWLAARAGDLLFVSTAKRQKVYFFNLLRVLGPDASADLVHRTARRAFQNLVKNYFDLFRSHGLTREQINDQIASVEGLDYLSSAMALGKGLVAGSAHFGSWDMVLQLAAIRLNREIVVPNERLKPEQLNQYVLNLRAARGIRMVPIDVAPRAMIKALRAGNVVGLAYDRDITRTGPIVDFMGAPTQLPDGAVQLSLKYGCPVIIGFSIRQPDNKSRVYVEPPFEFAKTGNMEADICAGVQKMAAVMERYIRQNPDQWLVFQKIWDEPGESENSK